MTGIRRLRFAALVAVGVLVATASLVSFAESYRGLYLWAAHHRLSGAWAVAWPLQIDVFIAVGELALFIALADRWPVRSRLLAWSVTIGGLAASVAGNVGHITGTDLASRVTAAVPPLAAAAALTVGLGVLKRVVAGSAENDSSHVPATDTAGYAAGNGLPAHLIEAQHRYAAELAGGVTPPIRRIRSDLGIGQAKATEVQAHLAVLAST